MQRLIIAIACALTAACTHQVPRMQPATPAAALPPAPAAAPVTAPPAPQVPAATPATASVPAPAAATAAPEPAPAPAPARPPTVAAPKTAATPARAVPAAKPAALPSAAPAAAVAAVAPATPAAAPAATLDLPLLEQRLKDTRAIGVFTKLSLKNQVDDLLTQFRAYHKGASGKTLPQLRQSYEVLLLKVVSLLQDDDPQLAAAVGSSREAIWSVLADPRKFASLDA